MDQEHLARIEMIFIQGSYGFQTRNTTRQNPECSEEERKFWSSYSEKFILKENQSYILNFWIGLK